MIRFLFLTACLAVFGAEKKAGPGIGALSLGSPKAKAAAFATTDSLLKDCEVVLDTNVYYISAPKTRAIRYQGIDISSIKCLFNKKKTIQGINVIFPAKTVDDLEKIVAFAEKMLGPATLKSGERIGFMFEAEWSPGEYAASFFANDKDYEAVLLLGFPKFVKEEEERGRRFKDQ